MSAQHRHHGVRASSTAVLRIDDGRVTNFDECRATVRSKDGTVIHAAEGRDALKSKIPVGFRTILAFAVVSAAILFGVKIGIWVVKLSLVVLQR